MRAGTMESPSQSLRISPQVYILSSEGTWRSCELVRAVQGYANRRWFAVTSRIMKSGLGYLWSLLTYLLTCILCPFHRPTERSLLRNVAPLKGRRYPV